MGEVIPYKFSIASLSLEKEAEREAKSVDDPVSIVDVFFSLHWVTNDISSSEKEGSEPTQ